MIEPTMRVEEAWDILAKWITQLESISANFPDDRIIEAKGIVYQVLADNGWVSDPDDNEFYDLSFGAGNYDGTQWD